MGAVRLETLSAGANSVDDVTTVSVPGAGTTVVSSSDGHRTLTIDPLTAVTTPSRSCPLPDDSLIRSPTLTMNEYPFVDRHRAVALHPDRSTTDAPTARQRMALLESCQAGWSHDRSRELSAFRPDGVLGGLLG